MPIRRWPISNVLVDVVVGVCIDTHPVVVDHKVVARSMFVWKCVCMHVCVSGRL